MNFIEEKITEKLVGAKIKTRSLKRRNLKKKKGNESLIIGLILCVVGIVCCIIYRNAIFGFITTAVTSLTTKWNEIINATPSTAPTT